MGKKKTPPQNYEAKKLSEIIASIQEKAEEKTWAEKMKTLPNFLLMNLLVSDEDLKAQCRLISEKWKEAETEDEKEDMASMLFAFIKRYLEIHQLYEQDSLIFMHSVISISAGAQKVWITGFRYIYKYIENLLDDKNTQQMESFMMTCIESRMDYKRFYVNKELRNRICGACLKIMKEDVLHLFGEEVTAEMLTNTDEDVMLQFYKARETIYDPWYGAILNSNDKAVEAEDSPYEFIDMEEEQYEDEFTYDEEDNEEQEPFPGLKEYHPNDIENIAKGERAEELSGHENEQMTKQRTAGGRAAAKAEAYIKKYPSPKHIKDFLDRWVYKQDDAKAAFSQLVFEKAMHLKFRDKTKQPTLLLCGPTGSGKTYIAEMIQKTNPPFPVVIIDSTQLTSPGFKGKDLDELLGPHFIKNPGLEHGIIVFDEFDKLCCPKYTNHGENVSEEIQASLLKAIEGTTLHYDKVGADFSTQDVTFVFCGAFSKLFDEAYSVPKKKNAIGFASEAQNNESEEYVPITQQMIKLGMLPEIAGRIAIVSRLDELTAEDYLTIMTTMEGNRTLELKDMFSRYYGLEVEIEDGAMHKMAAIAHKLHLGARGAGSLLERACRDNLDAAQIQGAGKLRITEEMLIKTEKKTAAKNVAERSR